MKIDLFENKYKSSNGFKIFFIDIVCFLLVAVVSIGFCYSYFSHSIEISGFSTTANVDVEYQYYDTQQSKYVVGQQVYGKINNGAEQLLTGAMITPGDTITILGRVVNTSNVAVYVLAKLTIVVNGEPKEIWYNIGTNDAEMTGVANSSALPNANEEYDYKTLTMLDMTTPSGKTDKVYQVGAGSLAGSYKSGEETKYHHKDLAIPYVFTGSEYKNGDTITSITLTIHVHQRDHLSSAKDFIELYKPHATNISEGNNGFINGYTTESIYAAHYITGNKLS